MNILKEIKTKNRIIIIAIYILVLFLIIFLFFIYNFVFAKVEGDSMIPNLDNNDIIVYNKNVTNIERFDIIIIKVNNDLLIKRVVGLPGEKIKYLDNSLYVNNEMVEETFLSSVTKDFELNNITTNDTITKNNYLVLGDNRLYSTDSRTFGLIEESNIVGILYIKLF